MLSTSKADQSLKLSTNSLKYKGKTCMFRYEVMSGTPEKILEHVLDNMCLNDDSSDQKQQQQQQQQQQQLVEC